MTKNLIFVILVSALSFSCTHFRSDNPAAGQGKSDSSKTAKNIIIMVGDGMGFNHMSVADLYQHGKQQAGPCRDWPVQLAMSTYMAGQSYDPDVAWKYFYYVGNAQAPGTGAAVGLPGKQAVSLESCTRFTDSAAAGTAMATGVKSYKGAVGVDLDQQVRRNLLEAGEDRDKSTGVVTSVPFSHATPAAFCVHNWHRNNYENIARDMLYKSDLEVIMGAGHPLYNDDNVKVDALNGKYIGGAAVWRDIADDQIVNGADLDGDGKKDLIPAEPWTVLQETADFAALTQGDTPSRVFGLARCASTLQCYREGIDEQQQPFDPNFPLNKDVPTLQTMTKAALNVLDNNPQGFVLMIEAGAIDWAGHANQLGRLIEEQVDFYNSIEAVVDWVEKNSSWNETLIIVTADHETGYLTGPDSGPHNGKPVWNSPVNNGKGRMPGVAWWSGSHTNQLVPFFAKGASCELFDEIAVRQDPVRGRFIDNTDLAKVVFKILQSP